MQATAEKEKHTVLNNHCHIPGGLFLSLHPDKVILSPGSRLIWRNTCRLLGCKPLVDSANRYGQWLTASHIPGPAGEALCGARAPRFPSGTGSGAPPGRSEEAWIKAGQPCPLVRERGRQQEHRLPFTASE